MLSREQARELLLGDLAKRSEGGGAAAGGRGDNSCLGQASTP